MSSENFKLFQQALKEYHSQEPGDKKESVDALKCKHVHVDRVKNVEVCRDCGVEINRDLQFDKEWRYYGNADTRFNSDPNRCQARKSTERNIYKDTENLGFSDRIISIADELYQEVTGGKVFRGNSRKAIVFACVFHAYKIQGDPKSCEYLIEIFGLDRKIGLKGLKHVNLNSKKISNHTTYITPENLITEIMNKFEAPTDQINEVIELYQKVKNRSSVLNRSRPQSVASGLVRYYILLKGKDISMKDFRQKVHLSELTIERIAKEIARILKTPWVIK